jgi:hypothetical protein
MNRRNDPPWPPCPDFAGLLPATRGTRPLPLDPLPSSLFRVENHCNPSTAALTQNHAIRFHLNCALRHVCPHSPES